MGNEDGSAEDAELAQLSETESPHGRLSDADAEPLLLKLASGATVSDDEFQRLGRRLAEPYNSQVRAAMMSPAGVEFARRQAQDHVGTGGGLLHRHLFKVSAGLLTDEPVAYWTESGAQRHTSSFTTTTDYSSDVLTLKDGDTRKPVASIEHLEVPFGFAQTWCLVWGTPDQGSTVVLVNPMLKHHANSVFCTKIQATVS